MSEPYLAPRALKRFSSPLGKSIELLPSKQNVVQAVIDGKAFNAITTGGKYEYAEEDGRLKRQSWGIAPLDADAVDLAVIWLQLDVEAHQDGQEYDLAAPDCPVVCAFTDKYSENLVYAAFAGTVKFHHNIETKVLKGHFSFAVVTPGEDTIPVRHLIEDGHLYIGPRSEE
ncbi:hypothetical protein [Rheinheimera sp. NSM]|uniref:hypothetical protein n=1 Tax=Rheinheimera sp. NSM TaxID=3457884 RepID=UPI0040350765